MRTATFAAAAALSMLSLSSCKPGPDFNGMKETASEVVMMLAEDPAAVDILGRSNPDSLFNRQPINAEERFLLMQRLMEYEDSKASQPADGGIVEDYDMSTVMQLQSIIMPGLAADADGEEKSDRPEDFSGWRVKVEYSDRTRSGKARHAERWVVFDKSGKHVLHSFDVPLLD